MSNIISREERVEDNDIDIYIREIDEIRSHQYDDEEQEYIPEEEYVISDVNYDILDCWLLMTEDEREDAWNNYTDEEREELNDLREELKFLLYLDSWN